MSYLPLIAFLLAVAWMIWRGYEAKAEYLRSRKTQEQLGQSTATSTAIEDRITEALKAMSEIREPSEARRQSVAEALKAQRQGQSQTPEFTEALAGHGQARG